MVTRFLESKADVFYALLRILAGLMFTFHGIQKHFGVLTNFRPAVGSQLWFGGLIELICGLAIAVGFFTSWTAFLASGTMAVAYIQFHWKFDFGRGPLESALCSFVWTHSIGENPGTCRCPIRRLPPSRSLSVAR